MIKTLLVAFLLTLISIAGDCRDNETEIQKFWFDAALGVYTTENTDGLSLGVSVNLIRKNNLLKSRFIFSQEFQILGPDPLEEFYDFGILAGKGFSWKYLQIYFSGGIGILDGTLRGKYLYTEPDPGWFTVAHSQHYERINFITPALPIEIDLQLKPAKYLGIGFSLFGNLNFRQPVFGFLVKIGIGRFR